VTVVSPDGAKEYSVQLVITLPEQKALGGQRRQTSDPGPEKA
jgi:hypothetical protein